MKTVYDYLKFVGFAYFAEIILFVILLLYGLVFFVKDNSNSGILITIGMLTFVSVLFSFLYSITNLRDLFNDFIDLSVNKMKSHAIKKLKSDDFFESIKTTNDIEAIKSLKNWVNPELWLYVSIFLYIISLIFGLLPSGMSNNITIVTVKNLQGVSFYGALTSTLFLLTSIVCLTFISKQRKIQKIKS